MMKDAFERRRCPPMNFLGRVSTDESDPGYANCRELVEGGYHITVLLDGIEQIHCQTADPDQGWVCRPRMVKGKPVIFGDAFQTEIVKGNVVVRLSRVI
jgi:hypothetical protein